MIENELMIHCVLIIDQWKNYIVQMIEDELRFVLLLVFAKTEFQPNAMSVDGDKQRLRLNELVDTVNISYKV